MFYRLLPATNAPRFTTGKALPVSKPAPAAQKFARRPRATGAQTVGEGSAPLSNAQKAKICSLAKDAWIAVGPDENFEDWRHAEQLKACGVASLLVAGQSDFLRILGHFQKLAGEDLRSAHSTLRGETGAKRTAWHILLEELAKKKLPEAYAAAICKNQFKITLGECSPKQLWCLIYTVRNRKKVAKGKMPRAKVAKVAKEKGEEPF